jgi:hypothetical protein
MLTKPLDRSLQFLYTVVTLRYKHMTVTTNEHGQQNMWAVEPPMVVEEYNKKGLFSPMQQKEMYNGRWAMMGIVMGFVAYAINGKFFFGIF